MKKPYTVVVDDDGFYAVAGPKRPIDKGASVSFAAIPEGFLEASKACDLRNLEYFAEQNAPALIDLYAAFQSGAFHGHPDRRHILVDTWAIRDDRQLGRYTYDFDLPHTLSYYIDRGLLERVPGAMAFTVRLAKEAAYLAAASMKWTESPVAKAFRAWKSGANL